MPCFQPHKPLLPPPPPLLPILTLRKAWRERVFPLLRDHLAHRVDSAVAWSLLFQETAAASLLEVRARRRGGHNLPSFSFMFVPLPSRALTTHS